MSARIPFGEVPEYPGPLTMGMQGDHVKLFQELLTLLGFTVDIDGDFDAATRNALRSMTGAEMVSEKAWNILTASFSHALREIPTKRTLQETALAYARRHLKSGAREVGHNEGPWVRLYTRGFDGPEYNWCAGFVSFCIAQAKKSFADPAKGDAFGHFPYTLSHNEIGKWARDNDVLITGGDDYQVQPGSLFLEGAKGFDLETNPRYTHVGFVDEYYGDSFTSIEGTFNDKVMAKYRAFGARVVHFVDPSVLENGV